MLIKAVIKVIMFNAAVMVSVLSAKANDNILYYSDVKVSAQVHKDTNTGIDTYAHVEFRIFGLETENKKLSKRFITFRVDANYLRNEKLQKFAFRKSTFTKIPTSLIWSHETIYLGSNGSVHTQNNQSYNATDLYYKLSDEAQLTLRAICGSFTDKNILKPWLNDAANSAPAKFKPYFKNQRHISSLQALGGACSRALPNKKVKFRHISKKPTVFKRSNTPPSNNTSLCGYSFQENEISKSQRIKIQELLKVHNFYRGALDGIFGKNSCFGLKNYLIQNKFDTQKPLHVSSLSLGTAPSTKAFNREFENISFRSIRVVPYESAPNGEDQYSTASIYLSGVKSQNQTLHLRPNLILQFVSNYKESEDFSVGFHGVPFTEGGFFNNIPDELAHPCCEKNTIFLPSIDDLKKYFQQASQEDRAMLVAACGSYSDPVFVESILSQLRNTKSMPQRYRDWWSSPAHAEFLIQRAETCNYELTGSAKASAKFIPATKKNTQSTEAEDNLVASPKQQELQNDLHKAKIKQLEADLKQEKTTSDALLNTLKATEGNNVSHIQKLHELEEQLEAVKASKKSSEKELNKRYQILAKNFQEMKSAYVVELKQTDEKILHYNTVISNLNANLLDAETKIQALKAVEGRLNKENSRLTAELDQAKSKNEKLANANQYVKGNLKNPKFSLSSDWTELERWITPSQMRFCSILNDYEFAKVESKNSGNQLLQNLAISERDQDIEALLRMTGSDQSGFTNWIGLVDRVFAQQAINPKTNKTELAAGIIIKTPCGITMGTGRLISKVNGTAAEFKQLAFSDDVIYSQLANLRRGEPILFNGSLLKSDATTSDKYITNEAGNEVKTQAYTKPSDAPDMFIDISYFAKL